MTAKLGAPSLAIEEELGCAINRAALRDMSAKKRHGGLSVLDRQARGDLDARPGGPKKALSKPRPRNSSAPINIRCGGQLFALSHAFGVPAARVCTDCVAKVPAVVNAQYGARTKWMLTEGSFSSGPRFFDWSLPSANVSGLVELGVKRPG